jgi:hypothetical protein
VGSRTEAATAAALRFPVQARTAFGASFVNIDWKDLGHRASPRNWSGMVWGVVLMVLLCAIGTAVVGVELYQITDRPVEFNPH